MNITVRKATQADIGFLLRLRKITMTEYLEQAGLAISDDAHLQRINDHFCDAQIIELDEKAVGMIKARFSPKLNQWRLIQIQIHPDYQNMGLGRHTINQLIQRARARNAGLVLSVLKINPAIMLYKRLGFITSSETECEFEMQLKKQT